jgi:hypothetical protein
MPNRSIRPDLAPRHAAAFAGVSESILRSAADFGLIDHARTGQHGQRIRFYIDALEGVRADPEEFVRAIEKVRKQDAQAQAWETGLDAEEATDDVPASDKMAEALEGLAALYRRLETMEHTLVDSIATVLSEVVGLRNAFDNYQIVNAEYDARLGHKLDTLSGQNNALYTAIGMVRHMQSGESLTPLHADPNQIKSAYETSRGSWAAGPDDIAHPEDFDGTMTDVAERLKRERGVKGVGVSMAQQMAMLRGYSKEEVERDRRMPGSEKDAESDD